MQKDREFSGKRFSGHPVTISVVIPVFNEEETLTEIHKRISKVFESIDSEGEILFVNDGSTDGSLDRMKAIQQEDTRVRIINLARNFGQQPAIAAGLQLARGDAVIVLDADLQDRPETIMDMFREWRRGAEVVYAIRKNRKEGRLKRIFFSSFYQLFNRISVLKIPLDAGAFSLMDRKVVNIINSMGERNKYIPGLRCYAGFRQVGIEVERDGRMDRRPRVSRLMLLKLAIDAFTSFSHFPLRLATLMGMVFAAISGFVICMVVGIRVLSLLNMIEYRSLVSGWTSLIATTLFMGSLILVCLGIIGEYIGRIYDEVKGRPYFIIESISEEKSSAKIIRYPAQEIIEH